MTEFDAALGERKELVVITKADLPQAAAVRREFAEKLGRDIFLISAAARVGLRELTEALAEELPAGGAFPPPEDTSPPPFADCVPLAPL